MRHKSITISQQIQKLRDKGMQIEDEASAVSVLWDIGYYRLGFYCFPFELNYPYTGNKRIHQYRHGTSFEDVMELYHFDSKLRILLMEALIRIEINFRTKVNYEAANAFDMDKCWFVNDHYVTSEYASSFNTSVYQRIKWQPVIQKHHRKHDDTFAPAWKTLEFVSFGDIIRLYEAILSIEVKRNIARHYGVRNIAEMVFYLNIVRELRNSCAHGKVLFDLKLQRRALSGVVLDFRGSTAPPIMNLYNTIKVVLHLLKHISHGRAQVLSNTLDEMLRSLSVNPNVRSFFETASGYAL